MTTQCNDVDVLGIPCPECAKYIRGGWLLCSRHVEIYTRKDPSGGPPVYPLFLTEDR